MRNYWKGIMLASAVITAMSVAGQAEASALPQMNGKLWLVKSNDAAIIGEGTYAWTGCGVTTAPPPASKAGPCLPGQQRIYAGYWALARHIAAGTQPPHTTVIFDQEGWTATPLLERQHPAYYIQRACQLAAAHHVWMIATPTTGGMVTLLAAARYCPALDLQIQYASGLPGKYLSITRKDVTAIRKVSKTVIILDGLAPDARGGIPTTAALMAQSYQAVKSLVQGFWLNAAVWSPARGGTGCAPQGCPGVDRAFLALTGS